MPQAAAMPMLAATAGVAQGSRIAGNMERSHNPQQNQAAPQPPQQQQNPAMLQLLQTIMQQKQNPVPGTGAAPAMMGGK